MCTGRRARARCTDRLPYTPATTSATPPRRACLANAAASASLGVATGPVQQEEEDEEQYEEDEQRSQPITITAGPGSTKKRNQTHQGGGPTHLFSAWPGCKTGARTIGPPKPNTPILTQNGAVMLDQGHLHRQM